MTSVQPSSRTGLLVRAMSLVEVNHMRFVIMDCPTEDSLGFYLEELKKHTVSDIVRLCEPTYSREYFQNGGIHVTDLMIKDGGIPAPCAIETFLQLCESRFGPFPTASHVPVTFSAESGPAIAVHCVAGLGRAPVMVAIALVEAGIAPIDAIALIRQKRRGAFNSIQIKYLMDDYRRQHHKKKGAMTGSLGSFLSRRSISPPNRDAHFSSTPAPASLSASGASLPNTGASGMGEIASRLSTGGGDGKLAPSSSAHSLKESFAKVFKIVHRGRNQSSSAANGDASGLPSRKSVEEPSAFDPPPASASQASVA